MSSSEPANVVSAPINIGTGDEELVITPAGRMSKYAVHAVPDGAKILHTPAKIQIIGADGTVLHTAYIRQGVSKEVDILPTGRSESDNFLIRPDHMTYTSWENDSGKPFTSFDTVWPVPSIPTSWNGQLLYWSTFLSVNSPLTILKPVLQYGVSPAGGGAYYAVASWYIIQGRAYHSSLTKVSVGQKLTATMTLSSTTSSYHNWNSVFAGISPSSLDISTEGVLIFERAWAAFDAYTRNVATDLPVEETAMTGINITTGDQHPAEICWLNPQVDGQVYMSVISTSATNGALHITYKQ